MNWMQQIGNLLDQYTNPGQENFDSIQSQAGDHFDKVADAAPPKTVSEGIGEAFRSNQTPPFEQMLSQLFNQSNGDQKAGLLNKLIQLVGPTVLSQLGLNQTSNVITAADANKVNSQDVESVAAHEQNRNPGIINAVSDFYAQHPALVKQLGTAALTIALAKIAKSQRVM